MPSPAANRLNEYITEHGYRYAYSILVQREPVDRSIVKYIAPNGAPVLVEMWDEGRAFEVYGALDNTNSVADTMTALERYGARTD